MLLLPSNPNDIPVSFPLPPKKVEKSSVPLELSFVMNTSKPPFGTELSVRMKFAEGWLAAQSQSRIRVDCLFRNRQCLHLDKFPSNELDQRFGCSFAVCVGSCRTSNSRGPATDSLACHALVDWHQQIAQANEIC